MNWPTSVFATSRYLLLLSRNVIGHGSATAAILRVDPDNELVITQTRRRGGADYDQHLTSFLLAVEAGLE